MTKRIIFECAFVYEARLRHVNTSPDYSGSEGMNDFIRGFWLNDMLELTYDRDQHAIWIPAHKIEYITRKEYEVDEVA